MSTLMLLLGLVIVLISAEIFTNGIEWLGKKLHLSEGAVGSVLAAVGTALPETIIPVIAILFSSAHSGEEIGLGAILGAPFMLVTLALALVGIAGLVFPYQGAKRTKMLIDPTVISRDLTYFIPVYTLAIAVAFIDIYFLKVIVALSLIALYTAYVVKTISNGKVAGNNHLGPLYFARKQPEPPLATVYLQVGTALVGIVVGANLFVHGVEYLAQIFGISAFVLSIIIAPIATELPEKFNSIIWIRKGKDTLAFGNITGAMVFQSSIVPVLGILLTPWKLSSTALLSAILAVLAALYIIFIIKKKGELRPGALLLNGVFYLIFLGAVLI
ncbi:sodium:calcium antiporter [Bacillota bacterium LX-D]|nr:sodium:calcium antiporter [Bacillota bacterium LX-D]